MNMGDDQIFLTLVEVHTYKSRDAKQPTPEGEQHRRCPIKEPDSRMYAFDDNLKLLFFS